MLVKREFINGMVEVIKIVCIWNVDEFIRLELNVSLFLNVVNGVKNVKVIN